MNHCVQIIGWKYKLEIENINQYVQIIGWKKSNKKT